MNKAELIDSIACKTELSKKDVTSVIDTFTDVVVDQLREGNKVQLYGFGYFEVMDQKERVVINKETGEEKIIPAKKNPKFRISTSVKNILNG